MKQTQFLLLAAMGLTVASCSDDLADLAESTPTNEGTTAIMFGSNTNKLTRADHATSANLLGGKFYIYGSKTKGSNPGTTTAIFDNYQLQYKAGSAGSSDTNVKDWEYVGMTSKKGASQDVKYWDYTSDSYNFVAAAGLADNEIITNSDSIKINVASQSAVDGIYIADRITATPKAKAATNTTPASQAYKETVTFQFRRMGARMRIGFYETVPGYAIKDLVFYYVGAAYGSKTLGVGGAFPESGKYNVTYDKATNAAVVKFNGGSNKMAWSSKFGKLDYTSVDASKAGQPTKYMSAAGKVVDSAEKVFLGSSSATATFAKGTYTIDGESKTSDYKPILPNENNSLKMQLRVDYTLVALDGSGDVINVRDAYVSVPVEYCQWKPNYTYTYLFKISDKSNGYTGGNNKDDDRDPSKGDGRKPNPDTGGDTDIEVDSIKGDTIPPYIPQPDYVDPETGDTIPQYIPDPDNPNGPNIPNPDCPVIPNPNYPTGPKGDQHDPSNPVPSPIDPSDPDNPKPDPDDPAGLYPITFDAVVVDTEEHVQETVTTVSTPSITATSEGQSVVKNNEFKKGQKIVLTVQDGTVTGTWQWLRSDTEISEEKAEKAYGESTAWTSISSTAVAQTHLTPTSAGYYVVRVKVGTTYGYKVIKVVD